MDHEPVVYKIDSLVQSSLLSSLVLNSNTRILSYPSTLRTLSYNTHNRCMDIGVGLFIVNTDHVYLYKEYRNILRTPCQVFLWSPQDTLLFSLLSGLLVILRLVVTTTLWHASPEMNSVVESS